MSTPGKRRKPMLAYVVLAVTALIMVSIFARIDNWQRDWTTNTARLDPLADDPDLRPATLNVTPDQASELLRQWVESESSWTVVKAQETETAINIQLTRTTRFLRFVDDIDVRLIADGGTTRVEAKSESRFGKGDLGQNPRNLKELVRGLESLATK